jgi:FkbM family methyltransferase
MAKKKIPATGQTHGRMAIRDRFADIKHHIPDENPVIVDGGAFVGFTIEKFLGIFDKPKIHAFEPIPDLAQSLNQKYSTRGVHIYQAALGSKNERIPFNIVNAAQSSSVLQPGHWVRKYHGEKMDIRETIEVESVRLDTIMKRKKIDILKLDLQGFELEALKGAGRKLYYIRLITVEVEFVELYEGQPLFSQIESFLRNHRFRLFNLYELWTHPDGQLTAGDAVFLNNRYFKF